MRFFKKRGKPRQYRIIREPSHFGYVFYVLEAWNRTFSYWEYLALRNEYHPHALEILREHAAIDAKVMGYGDNYEITEVL